jgi:hypothetical protein
MRFCQSDGTPLEQAAEPVDPYKTMVASKDDIAAALNASPVASAPPEHVAEPETGHDEVLDIPDRPEPIQSAASQDPFSGPPSADEPEGEIMEIPPLVEPVAPEPPRFNEPSVPAPSFGEPARPASPFSEARPSIDEPRFENTKPPIPSPFSGPKPATFEPPPKYVEPEPVTSPPAFDPFQQHAAPAEQAVAQAEWTPPPAPDSSWQNQEIGQNTPLQPPPAGVSLNQTLPIVSLILGIVSLCCYISPVTGIAALITGFMGMKNVKNDPAQYGGKTLAIIGMILGGLFFLVGVVYYLILILMWAGILAGSLIPNIG